MASFKDTLAKWQTASTPLTPEAQARKIKESREKQKEAVKIARARAARYNMTLRALSIKSIKEQTEAKKKDLEAVKEAKERAMKYNMTSRALALATSRNQQNAAKALDPEVSPAMAKQMLSRAAFYQASTASKVSDPEASEKQRMQAAIDALDKLPEDGSEESDGKVRPVSLSRPFKKTESKKPAPVVEVEQEDEEEYDESEEQETPKPTTAKEEDEHEEEPAEIDDDKSESEEEVIVIEDLAKAVAEGDENGVNRAILHDFLQQHAPHRVHEVDSLLEQYKGSKVEMLFTELIESYPDPAEAKEAGEEAAIQSAMEKVAATMDADEEIPDEESEKQEDDEEEEEEEEISAIEQQRREREAAEKKEKAKLASMSEEEKMDYFKEKEAEKAHREKKDKMLKDQLDVYSKGSSAAGVVSAVSKRLSTKKSVERRLSRKVEEPSEDDSAKSRSKSVAGEGFILSIAAPKKTGNSNRESVNLNSSKWAVNVQPQLLRERMRKAGVNESDIEALMSEESDML